MASQTEISEIGEFSLIERLTKNNVINHSSTIKAVGDDCAVIEKNKTTAQVITTDLLMEGIHFDLQFTPLKHLGYKAVSVNVSDIYAMNAVPTHITVSIAVSAKFSVEALEQLYEGIYAACKAYNVDLVGGDTSASLTGLAISITAFGEAPKKQIVYRKNAKKHNLVCVTGDLGAAYTGLQVLQREKIVYNKTKTVQPKLDGYEYVIQRFLKPEAQKKLTEVLLEKGIQPTAMIDVSDGLSSELFHICTQSKVGCVIYEEKIPIAQETADVLKEFNIEPIIPALNGGEDYEILFTVPLDAFDTIKQIPGIHIIGNIVDESEGLQMVSRSGDYITLRAQGWNAFE